MKPYQSVDTTLINSRVFITYSLQVQDVAHLLEVSE